MTDTAKYVCVYLAIVILATFFYYFYDVKTHK